jgi:hypothetical protein
MRDGKRRSAAASATRWGQAPWPLVPRVLRIECGHLPAPDSLAAVAGRPLKLADLDREFWKPHPAVDRRHLSDLVKCLDAVIRTQGDLPIVADSCDRLVSVAELDLSTQTTAVLKRLFGNGPVKLALMSFDELLKLPGVGIRRVLEIASALDAMLPARNEAAELPAEFRSFFRQLADWADTECFESTFTNVLPEPHPQWPDRLVDLWHRLGQASLPGVVAHHNESDEVPALIQQAIAVCSPLQLVILRARVLSTTEPTRLEVLSAALGETPARIIELEQQGIEFLHRFEQPEYRLVLRRAERLRAAIGVAIPDDHPGIREALAEIMSDFDRSPMNDVVGELLLWLAGPYRRHNGWLAIGGDIVGRSTAAIMDHSDAGGAVRMSAVHEALTEIGILPQFQAQWIDWLVEVVGIRDWQAPAASRPTDIHRARA